MEWPGAVGVDRELDAVAEEVAEECKASAILAQGPGSHPQLELAEAACDVAFGHGAQMCVLGDEQALVGRVRGAERRAEHLRDGDASGAGGPVDKGRINEGAGDGWGIAADARKVRGDLIVGLGPIERANKVDDPLPYHVWLHTREVSDVLADLSET